MCLSCVTTLTTFSQYLDVSVSVISLFHVFVVVFLFFPHLLLIRYVQLSFFPLSLCRHQETETRINLYVRRGVCPSLFHVIKVSPCERDDKGERIKEKVDMRNKRMEARCPLWVLVVDTHRTGNGQFPLSLFILFLFLSAHFVSDRKKKRREKIHQREMLISLSRWGREKSSILSLILFVLYLLYIQRTTNSRGKKRVDRRKY